MTLASGKGCVTDDALDCPGPTRTDPALSHHPFLACSPPLARRLYGPDRTSTRSQAPAAGPEAAPADSVDEFRRWLIGSTGALR